MTDSPGKQAKLPGGPRRSLRSRLRPFVRRDLRARVISALLTVMVLTALGWLGISALTRMDSEDAHALRVEVGLEQGHEVCGPAGPYCTYDDREQADIDEQFALERRLRGAVLDELTRRILFALDRLDDADEMAMAMPLDEQGAFAMDTGELRKLISEANVDLFIIPTADLHWPLVELVELPTRTRHGGVPVVNEPADGTGRRHLLATGVARPLDARAWLDQEIELERAEYQEILARIERIRSRDAGTAFDALSVARYPVLSTMMTRRDGDARTLATALVFPSAPSHELDSRGHGYPMASLVDAELPEIGATLASLTHTNVDQVHGLLFDSTHPMWRDAWMGDLSPITKPAVRYQSPVTTSTRWHLLGTALLGLAGIMLVVVGPIVTATTTAREREAGTLPVLRMTGLGARDLAMAVGIGPNVFALVAGGLMLAVAVPVLASTAGVGALVVPLMVIAVLCVATHLTAIGLGDALGHRVNAMVVGGLMALAILGPGVVGTVAVGANMAATGLLLGPLPAVLTEAVRTAGLPIAMASDGDGMGPTVLAYALVSQGLLGLMCLASWQRRVERAWSPLFRPIEGLVLALASVGCSALAILDLSERLRVSDYDTANAITFVATGFLMPVIAWLLVASLRRPARAGAVATHTETRQAFWRFQGIAVLTAVAVGGAYWLVMQRTGLGREESELMWATLTQWVLVSETAVATLLWMSRKRTGRHVVALIGGAVLVLQIAFAVAVYGLEVEHVAFNHDSAMPLMLGMDVSPYWLAFLVLLWSAGLGLILAALLRERDRALLEQDDDDDDVEHGDGIDDNGNNPRRWLH